MNPATFSGLFNPIFLGSNSPRTKVKYVTKITTKILANHIEERPKPKFVKILLKGRDKLFPEYKPVTSPIAVIAIWTVERKYSGFSAIFNIFFAF